MTRWTQEEDSIVRENFPTKRAKGTQKLLPHRTLSAIWQRAEKLGAASTLWWTTNDDDKLRREYNLKTIDELAREFNRDYHSVHNRARRLGLKKSKEGLRLSYEQAKVKRGCKIPKDWSKLEKMYMEEKLSVPEISRRTGFKQGIIYARFRQRGILRSSNESQKLLSWAWKEEDKERLRQVYPSKPKDEVLRMFPNRTWNGIAIKARRLKVKRPYPPPHHAIPLEKADNAARAYLAGILDGEGTISVRQTQCGSIVPLVSVTNTDEGLIRWIGSILDLPYSEREEKCKNSFSVRCSQLWKVYRILELLEPYLRIRSKKTIATLVIDFCRMRFKRLYTPYTDEDKDTVIKVRKLNQRGVKLQKPFRWAGE